MEIPEYGPREFENSIILHNQLIALKLEEIVELYENFDGYCGFLDALLNPQYLESFFLSLHPDLVKKVESVIQIYRFGERRKEVSERVNAVIAMINELKALSPQELQSVQQSYYSYQVKMRNTKFRDWNQFLNSLGYDAAVYMAIVNNQLYLLEDDELVMPSLSFILNSYPELFDNPDYMDRALELVVGIENRSKRSSEAFKQFTKETKKALLKIKKGEE